MKWAYLNLFMMVLWLCLGIVVLFFPEQLGWDKPDSTVQKFGYLALGLGVWNAVRAFWLFSARRRPADRFEELRPIRRTPPSSTEEKEITDPQFSFEDHPRREGPPSANGHGSD